MNTPLIDRAWQLPNLKEQTVIDALHHGKSFYRLSFHAVPGWKTCPKEFHCWLVEWKVLSQPLKGNGIPKIPEFKRFRAMTTVSATFIDARCYVNGTSVDGYDYGETMLSEDSGIKFIRGLVGNERSIGCLSKRKAIRLAQLYTSNKNARDYLTQIHHSQLQKTKVES